MHSRAVATDSLIKKTPVLIVHMILHPRIPWRLVPILLGRWQDTKEVGVAEIYNKVKL